MPAIATPIDSHSKGPETFPEGRVCARPRCKHRLSRYNAGPLCHSCGGPTLDPKPWIDALTELMEETP